MPEENFQEKREPPKYSGLIQTSKERKKIGRMLLWESKSTNPKAPVLYGRLQTNYGTSLIALWKFSPRKKTEDDEFKI